MSAATADRSEAPSPAKRARLSGRTWLMLIVFTLLVRGGVIVALSSQLERDPDGYAAIATGLDRAGIFGREHQGQFSSTAFRPPLYPLMLAPLERLSNPAIGIGVLHVILGTITVWAVVCLALRWGLSANGALLAGVLVALDPILLYQSPQVMTETLAACLAALALLALTVACASPALMWATLAGACFGLCVLCRPTFLPWLLSVLFVLLWTRSLAPRRRVVLATVIALAAGAVIAPWGVRNFLRYGKPIVTTTHGGYTLLLANNPNFYDHLRTDEWGSVWDAEHFNEWWDDQSAPKENQEQVAHSLRMLELERDSLAYEYAFQFIRNDPAMFAWSCVVRVGRLWGVLPHQLSADESHARRALRFAIGAWYAIELSLAAMGLWSLGRRAWHAPWIWGLLLLASFTAVHAFFWTDLRMRAPLAGVIALLAAHTALLLATRMHSARPATRTT